MQPNLATTQPGKSLLQKGPEADLINELLENSLAGGGVKKRDIQQLAHHIVEKNGNSFPDITANNLQEIAATYLVEKLYSNEVMIEGTKQVISPLYILLNKKEKAKIHYICDKTLFYQQDLFTQKSEPRTLGTISGRNDQSGTSVSSERNQVGKYHFELQRSKGQHFQLRNRRYLGNKYKLLGFIEDIISEKCGTVSSFCDIFAGTGVVGERFNDQYIKIISNDFLYTNYACLYAFLKITGNFGKRIAEKIEYLNSLPNNRENYFSKHFGGKYFTQENARKIGTVREEIERIAENNDEKCILICSLIYAVDKIANTVGHYDAFRKKLDMIQEIKLLVPDINYPYNSENEVYREDANMLIRKISCDVLYIDPPYNSRQYSDAYHLLENLAEWKTPKVAGICGKMDRSHIKSNYCLKSATDTFSDLIRNANCKHILLSYNNTGNSKDNRSNARMTDDDILHILNNKGDVEVFERCYKIFTTRKIDPDNHSERIFYCRVKE